MLVLGWIAAVFIVAGVLLLLAQLTLEFLLQMVIVLRILLFHECDLTVFKLIGLKLSFTLLWWQLWTE
jgi:hypothetical protein